MKTLSQPALPCWNGKFEKFKYRLTPKYNFLFFYFPNTIFFLLYSMVTQLHIHVHILFLHIIMLHHKWLHSRTSLLIHSKGNGLYLLTRSSSTTPIPLPLPWQPQVYSTTSFLIESQGLKDLCRENIIVLVWFSAG